MFVNLAPAPYAAAMETLDLWTLPLQPRPGDVGLLDERERARFDRLRVAAKRDQFLAAQAGLRRVLGRYRSVPAHEIAFAYGPHGKPSLEDGDGPDFNLSHSEELALVGVSRDTEIGVDVEWQGRDRPFLRLGRRYFDEAEHAWLARRAEDAVREGFYRIWTLKEAFLKALGTGLTVPPGSFRIDLDADPPRLATTPDGADPTRWRLVVASAPAGYSAAVCWSGAPRRLVPRELTGRE